MKVLVCEDNSSNSSGTSSLSWWQTVWETYSRGLTSQTACLKKIFQEEQSPLIKQQIVWRNYCDQMTEKQNSVKTCTKSPKKGNTSHI